ncbi:endonuclease domain-containing protein [Microlunatus endophyticus]|uniref:endonuclease domain-containing protein n=1 Tax=Microlunatus endophyticus TaxID=1716077 RepID=UPI00166698C0|nr:DUF559 domain-containing protein [Microlunatus endophyticus]
MIALRAGQLWAGPDSVLIGRSAARLTFWPELEVRRYDFATPRKRHGRRGPWTLTQRVTPPELVWHHHGLRIAAPELTAIDLASERDGGDAIDRALRAGVTLDRIQAAFDNTRGRVGNTARKRLLRDSRDSPWSEAERRLHALLHAENIKGWSANYWIGLPNLETRGAFVDVLFKSRKVVVEVDGYEFHHDRAAFERDRRRRNELVLAGYTVLNFTWEQITQSADWVIGCIRRALAARV